jgi:5-methylcytosine-specific restriction endonuclease McrA
VPASSAVAGSWGGRKAQALTAHCLATKGRICHLCGLEGADTADHIIPRSKGGPDVPENLEPAHTACNRARGDLDLAEWRRRHPLPTRPALTPSREWT